MTDECDYDQNYSIYDLRQHVVSVKMEDPGHEALLPQYCPQDRVCDRVPQVADHPPHAD